MKVFKRSLKERKGKETHHQPKMSLLYFQAMCKLLLDMEDSVNMAII